MIRIQKSKTVPVPLDGHSTIGGRATQSLIEAAKSGQELPKFRGDIYGDPLVRKQLIADQHGKCAFCESKITATQTGDVEHFRPKGGWIQNASDRLSDRGYYWLAYEWANLMLGCARCNQRFKKNHFPLRNPDRRALAHEHELALEEPILINPTIEDPFQFISFHRHTPRGIDLVGRGAATIEILGLKRREMQEARLTKYELVRTLIRTRSLFHGREVSQADHLELKRIDQLLKKCARASSEFAAMCRCALRDAGL